MTLFPYTTLFRSVRYKLKIRTINVLSKLRRMVWAGNVVRMGEKRNACRTLVGKPDGKGPLGRRRRRWVENTKIDLRDI
jgi:hypothetical protein